MKGRHTAEDLAFLREKGFVGTADEIERLHKVEDAANRMRDRIDMRLNDYLCEMRPGEDDSMHGFNEAWGIVRKAFTDTSAPAPSDKIKYWWSGDREWFCILVNDGISQATVSLTVQEAESLIEAAFAGLAPKAVRRRHQQSDTGAN